MQAENVISFVHKCGHLLAKFFGSFSILYKFRFDSTGPLADSMYAFMIGTYEYVADDEGGATGVRGIYRCTDCSYDLQLYYNPPGNAFAVSILHNLAVRGAHLVMQNQSRAR